MCSGSVDKRTYVVFHAVTCAVCIMWNAFCAIGCMIDCFKSVTKSMFTLLSHSARTFFCVTELDTLDFHFSLNVTGTGTAALQDTSDYFPLFPR